MGYLFDKSKFFLWIYQELPPPNSKIIGWRRWIWRRGGADLVVKVENKESVHSKEMHAYLHKERMNFVARWNEYQNALATNCI